MKYFTNINTLDELKAAYRRLSMKHHPDRGGDTATMQEINAEHDELFEQLKLEGLTVELCGSWLWIGGDTRQHKETLKAAGCRWSNNKKLWYWHHAEEGRKWRRGKATMSDIRTKYGSQVFDAAGERTGYERIGATA